jgi:hypothetical protein
MKPRHAVTLALVGWYLMVPPTEDANQIDPSVPLPKWVVLRAFDTADARNEVPRSTALPCVTLESTSSRRIGSIGSGRVLAVHRQRRPAPQRKMKPHTHYRALAVVYTALTLAGLLWNHLPVEPYDPQPAEPSNPAQPDSRCSTNASTSTRAAASSRPRDLRRAQLREGNNNDGHYA